MPDEARVGGSANRPRAAAIHRAYPPALIASTLTAGLFCYLYLTKPVVEINQVVATHSPAATPGPDQTKANPAPLAQSPRAKALLHPGPALPGDTATRPDAATPPLPATTPGFGHGFEETNVRIQHALSAEGPEGELGRILLEVPVLYESRRLRWTPELVSEARQLLDRLRVHQENLRSIRQEGTTLLAAWNLLIDRSIPDDALRADSPSLPVNQSGGNQGPSPIGLDTSETIRVSSSGSP
jgi:hypothetical protein